MRYVANSYIQKDESTAHNSINSRKASKSQKKGKNHKLNTSTTVPETQTNTKGSSLCNHKFDLCVPLSILLIVALASIPIGLACAVPIMLIPHSKLPIYTMISLII